MTKNNLSGTFIFHGNKDAKNIMMTFTNINPTGDQWDFGTNQKPAILGCYCPVKNKISRTSLCHQMRSPAKRSCLHMCAGSDEHKQPGHIARTTTI